MNSYKDKSNYKNCDEKVETSVMTLILTLVFGLGALALSIDLHLKELAVIGIAVLAIGSLISLLLGKVEAKDEQ